jgi:spermidine/putrescine transport system ATP-binding protein
MPTPDDGPESESDSIGRDTVRVSETPTGVVELRNLRKSYGTVDAVRGVSLCVEDGRFFSLLGPSGCGKTTVLRTIAGFETPNAGDVYLGGVSVAGVPPHKRNVNTVFQHYALFPHMTVLENVVFGLDMKGVEKADGRRRALESLEMVRLSGYENRKPNQLSGGEQQRVALARALVNRPSVLLLDEPLAALDLKLRKQMQAELKALQREVGITFLYVTHDQGEAMALSDRIAVMRDGEIQQVGTPEEIYEQPRNRFVADFIGMSNFVEGTVLRREPPFAELGISSNGNGNLLRVWADNAADAPVGRSIYANLRPERISLSPISAEPSHRNRARGIVTETVYLGTGIQYRVELDTTLHIVALQPNYGAAGRFKVGSPVFLEWAPEHMRTIEP